VLLLEDTDEAPYRVDRMLTQLRLTGALDGVRGIVFGDSPACEAPPEDTRSFPLTTVIGQRLGGLGVPLIYGFPCGHSPWRATLPLGIPATLDADAGTLTFPEPACVS
jgi:muramoyltetrapeptide carboxypeptidase